MKIKLPAYPLVIVEWEDSGRGIHWETISDAELVDDSQLCVSVGWLLHENDRRIIIMPHVGWDMEKPDKVEQVVGHMSIPVRAIVKRQTIKL